MGICCNGKASLWQVLQLIDRKSVWYSGDLKVEICELVAMSEDEEIIAKNGGNIICES